MGLKTDIKNAFIESVGGDSDNIDTLAEDLRNAIINFIVKQDFKITEMEAPYNILPGKINVVGGSGPSSNTAPLTGIAQISETSNKIASPNVPSAVKKSKVKLLQVTKGTE